MSPRFELPKGYAPREMLFVLGRDGRKGWRFFGHADGYSVPARNYRGEFICGGFATKREAETMARALNLPPYAVWNGRAKRYDRVLSHNDAPIFRAMAYPRG